jgi:rare lipoprotein A
VRGGLGGYALAAAAALALGGCAEGRLAVHAAKQFSNAAAPARAPNGSLKIGQPYQVDGVWYYPHNDPNYDETGLASWYGEPFHGRATANGETYDMNVISAAHKTLPLPSYVRVTNLDNGRSMVVRVNDRGPFVNGRIIDVSRRGAQLLGFYEKGTAKVRVTVVNDADGGPIAPKPATPPATQVALAAAPQTSVQAAALPPPAGVEAQTVQPQAPRGRQPAPVATAAPREAVPPPAEQLARAQAVEVVPVRETQLYIQAGAFLQYDNANRLSAQLSPYGQSRVSNFRLNGQEFYRVRIGPLQDVAAADATLEQLIAQGHTDARIVAD